jgi:simple sugar transport system permease protein
MNSQTTAAAPRAIDWRASITGGALILLALVIAFLLDSPWDSVSTFKISRPRDVWVVGHLTLPSQWFTTIAAVVLAFLGTRLFLKGGGRWTTLSLAVALVILAMAFLVWATAGK